MFKLHWAVSERYLRITFDLVIFAAFALETKTKMRIKKQSSESSDELGDPLEEHQAEGTYKYCHLSSCKHNRKT